MRPRSRFLPNLIETLETRRLLANVLGVDAASFQYDLNWPSLKSQGYIFGWEKATQGIGYENPYWNDNITAAKAAGVAIGSYCFADFSSDAASVANYFWNFISSSISSTDGVSLQPMLDCEQGQHESGIEDSWVATWCNTIIADGKSAGLVLQPIIYTDSSFADDYFTTATAKNESLWIAKPGSSAPTSSDINPWTSYEVWQYGEATFPTTSGQGSVATDVDRLNGDATELRNLIVGSGKFFPGSTVQTTANVKATQGSNGSGASTIVPANTNGQVLTYPVYYNNAWYDYITFTNGASGWVNQTSLVAVASAPSAPIDVSPANSTTVYVPPKLSWNNNPTALSYNVFINNSEIASGLTSTSYTTTSTTAGVYNWYIQAVNANGTTNGPTWSYTLSAPAAPTNSAPANNASIYTTPTLSWNSAAGATSYNVFLNNSQVASNLTGTSYTPSTLSTDTYSWYVQAHNSIGNTNGSAWSFTITTSVPTVSFPGQAPSVGASVFDFSITYTNPGNPTAQVNTETFGNSNITVTASNGYTQNAKFISQSQPGNGTNRGATYEITPPGGAWNAQANATYTITLNANQVADVGGGYATAGAIGTFTTNEPFAYLFNSQVYMTTVPGNLSVSWSQSGTNWKASNGASNVQFSASAFTGVNFVGASGNDSLTINSPMAVPLYYNGGAGQDTLNLSAGFLTFGYDLGAATSALTLNVSGNAAINFNSDQHLAALNLSGNATAALAPGGALALDTQNLSINGSAYIDLADNALAVESGDEADIDAYLARGDNSGLWNGPGINSHIAASSAGHSLGFSPASDLAYSSINGVAFSNTAVVVRYTYLGDANLDGKTNADDISLMMLAAAQQQTQQSQSLQSNSSAPQTSTPVYWYNGDYNYDHQVNQDDFLLFSLGSAVQNQQMLS